MEEKEVLTNEERRYFGLEPILEDWERFTIKPGYAVYFDGDVIRKIISMSTYSGEGWENFLDYNETDNEIHTRDRSVVLPRTKRGREKKLNYTSVDSMSPLGCSFQMNLRNPRCNSSLRVWNVRNSINLPIVFPDDLDTLAQFREWLTGFMASCPADYFDKVERMKHTPHRTIKYFNGDIFRFEIDLEHYGFGLIIGQLRKMQKDGLLRDEHILNNILGVPLLIRLYLFKTMDKDLQVEQIAVHPLGHTFIMMDNQVIWGAYEIVGNKAQEESDIDFPIQAGQSISGQDPDHVRLCWGPGIIVRRGATDFPQPLNQLMRHGCYFGVGGDDLERALENSLAEAGLDELEQRAFRYFGVPLDINFDEFNRQHDGMTRAEYAEYANKTGRCMGKSK